MAGYTRNDTPNNIADGNVINASDLDGEFDAIQTAFGTGGHTHDGTAGNGPQIGTGGIANDAVTLGTKTSGNYVAAGAVSGVGLSGSASAEGATFTVTSNATNANTASTIVARDASGNFSAGTITASLTGTASNANQLDSLDSTQFLRSDTADTKTAGDLSFADNVKANFGASSDLQLFHDGSNSYVKDVGTGSLILTSDGVGVNIQKGTTEIMAQFVADGANIFKYDNSTKLQTTATGATVTGELVADTVDATTLQIGNTSITATAAELNYNDITALGQVQAFKTVTADGNAWVNFGDNEKVRFGTGNDLEIYHDASHSYLWDKGTGNLYIQATSLRLNNGAGTSPYIQCNDGTDVKIYYNGSQKLATKTDGVDITGELQADSLDIDGNADISGTLTMGGNVDLQDNDRLMIGTGDDLQIYHTGSSSIIQDGSATNLILAASGFTFFNQAFTEVMLNAAQNGAVTLYYDGSAKLATKTDGVDITGELQSDSLDVDGNADISGNLNMSGAGNIDLSDGAEIRFGASQDLTIRHTGTNSFIEDNGTGSLYIDATNFNVRAASHETYLTAVENGAVSLYYDNAVKLNTASSGININGSINAVDNVYIASAIYHEGDTDTYMQFHAANQWRVVTGGTEMLEVNDSYINLNANSKGRVQTTSLTGSNTPDFYQYNSFVWTLTGNITLGNPATEQPGMSGVFIFIHSGAGRTVSLGTQYITVGGAGLTLSGTSGAVDIVPYFVRANGIILLGTPQLAFS